LKTLTPHATIGDGNCAFRAVSLAMYDTQEHHLYVRFLAACEIIDNPEFYDTTSPQCLITDARVSSSDIESLIRDVTTVGTCVELMHLFAISSSLKRCFQSYIPPVVSVGFAMSPYTVLVAGRNVPCADSAFTVMWTMTTVPERSDEFCANHVVLLTNRHAAADRVVHVEDTDDIIDDIDAEDIVEPSLDVGT
jgi:hypothetical protein